MHKISITMSTKGKGFFTLEQEGKIIGQILVRLIGSELILLDTIVLSGRYLHAVGTQLVREAVEYARMHELKIITLSKYVQKLFSSDPASYADVWEKSEGGAF
jgi:hypothetical protein